MWVVSPVLIWLVIKIVDSWNSTSEENEVINNPEPPMDTWYVDELDSEIIFPWEDVFKCKIIHDYNCNLSLCPKCFEENRKSIQGEVILSNKTFEKFSEVITVYFRTPDYTWKKYYGQEGYLSICIKHKRQIGFDHKVLN